MADPFGTGAGIVGVISLAIQITQVAVQFGMDWKDAPDDIKVLWINFPILVSCMGLVSLLLLLRR
jgi:hypothetical protein